MDPEWNNLSLLLDTIQTFSDNDKTAILREFVKVETRKGQILVKPGETCERFYFVNKGCLRTYFLTTAGQERTRLILPAYSIGTALTSFIGKRESFEALDSLEDSTLLAIGREAFYSLAEGLPAWSGFYRKILEMAYMFQNIRFEQLVSYSATERYELLRKENPELLQAVPSRVLASYLDIAPETLSRLKSLRN